MPPVPAEGCASGRKSVHVPLPPPGFALCAPLMMKSGFSVSGCPADSSKKICGRFPQPEASPVVPSV